MTIAAQCDHDWQEVLRDSENVGYRRCHKCRSTQPASPSIPTETREPEKSTWRVQYGRFFLNDKLVFDAQRFNQSVDLDQLSQLQRFAAATSARSETRVEVLEKVLREKDIALRHAASALAATGCKTKGAKEAYRMVSAALERKG